MKTPKITICGGFGRMGKILIKEILKNKNLILHSVTDIKIKIINNIKTQKNSMDAFRKSDVIIDFSNPKASLEILRYASHLKKNVVILFSSQLPVGTIKKMQEFSKKNFLKKKI